MHHSDPQKPEHPKMPAQQSKQQKFSQQKPRSARRFFPKEFNAFLESQATAILITALILPILLCLSCVGAVFIVGLPETGLVSKEVGIAIGLSLEMFIAVVTIGGGTIVATILWSKHVYGKFNAAFAPLALKRVGGFFGHLQFRGRFDGKPLEVGFMKRSGRLPYLTLYIDIEMPLLTRMSLGTEDSLTASWVLRETNKMQAVSLSEPTFAHLRCIAHEEHWANALLNAPEGHEALRRLMSEAGNIDIRVLMISPLGIRLLLKNLRINEITSQNLESWINDLVTIADVAEKLHPPVNKLEPTSWERKYFFHRFGKKEWLLRVTIGIIIPFLCIICIAACWLTQNITM